jgi:hypothetical protein
MPGRPAKLKDVRLGNANMLKQLPGRMRRAFRFAAPELSGEVLERFAQINVGFCLVKEIGEVLAEGIRFRHGV